MADTKKLDITEEDAQILRGALLSMRIQGTPQSLPKALIAISRLVDNIDRIYPPPGEIDNGAEDN